MNEGDRALEARRDATLRRLRNQANRSRFVQRTGRGRPTLKPITFLCAFRHDVRCPHGNFPQVRFYPARKSARAKLSPRRYGSSRCQRLDYAARQKARRRREALAEQRDCLFCGEPLDPEYRRGGPRKYHPACAMEAANAQKRAQRTPEATLAGKEQAVHQAHTLLSLAKRPDIVTIRQQRLKAAAEDLAAYKVTLAKRNEQQRRRRAKAHKATADAVLQDLGLDAATVQERVQRDPEFQTWAKARGLL